MAKYSEAIYGKSVYGNAAANNATYTIRFTATSNWYNSIKVEWGNLLEDADKDPVTHWRLVRSASGVPDHPDLGENILSGQYRMYGDVEGDVLGWGGEYTDDVSSAIYNDLAPLTSFTGSTEMTYSMWVYNGSWRMVGSDVAIIVPRTADTLNQMLLMLPGAWTSQDPIGFVTGSPDDSDLSLFMSGFSFYYDKLRSHTELLSAYSNHMYAPIELVRSSVQDLGFTDEAALGDLYNRSIYKVGNYVNAHKGTELGVHAYITALTHWGNTITLGSNLFLDYQGSSFEGTVGNWVADSGTLTAEKYSEYTTSGNVLGKSIVSAADSSLILQRTDGYFVRELGFGIYHLAGATGVLTYGDSYTKGIPVEKGKYYTFYMYFMKGDSGADSPTVTLSLDYYNAKGEYQYTDTSPSPVLDATWQRAQLGTYIDIAADIDIAVPVITFANALFTRYIVMDLGYFGETAKSDRYEDARTIKIGLFGERENLLPNPGFDFSDGGWTVINSHASTNRVTQSSEVSPIFGQFVGKVRSNGVAPCKVVSDWVPVQGDRQLTFSIYASTSRTESTRAIVGLEYSTPLLESDQENIVDGKFSASNFFEESNSFDLAYENRLSITSQNPDASKYGVAPSVRAYVSFLDVADGDSFYLDAALLEQVGEVSDFFQGNGAPTPVDPNTSLVIKSTDCAWESGIITNFIPNPSFESTTTGWSAGTRSLADFKFGSACLVLTAGQTTSATASLYNQVKTGTDLVASAYVKGVGAWQIQMTGVQTTATANYMITETDWVRISVPAVMDGTNVTISITSTSGGKVDAVQLEAGTTVPSAFSGPGVPGSSALYGAGVTRWVRYGSLESGRSYYWTNFMDKISRLNGSLESVLPLGSTWEIIYGDSTYRNTSGTGIDRGFRDSFETSLAGWTSYGDNSFSRITALGYTTGDRTVEGTHYAELLRTTAGTCGITSDLIKVSPYQNYHLCAAVRSSTLSPIKIKVYKYANAVDPGPSSIETIITPTTTTDWYYLDVRSLDKSLFNSVDNTYIKIDISTTAATGTVLDIDRVVLRPI